MNVGAALAGYNHYPSCTCGWCIGGGSAGSAANSRHPVYSDYDKKQAAQILQGCGATSYSRCFVDPNASCPVCGQSVYFYSNESGSRVFFDELGKPWTKHPCTDIARPVSNSVFVRPSSRPIAEIRKILDAEKKLDNRVLSVGRLSSSETWRLAVVVEVLFVDFLMEVRVADLESQDHHSSRFLIYCDQPLLAEGDIISRRGDTFSFLHPQSFKEIEVSDGDHLIDLEALERDVDTSIIPNDVSEIVPTEMRHFRWGRGRAVTVPAELCSVLEDFSARGIVGPKLVSHYLNQTDRITADGSTWTPRLAYFLIEMSGVSQEKPVRKKKPIARRNLQKGPERQPKARAKPRPRSSRISSSNSVPHTANKTARRRVESAPQLTTDVDEWARMLSKLGRVSKKDNDGS